MNRRSLKTASNSAKVQPKPDSISLKETFPGVSGVLISMTYYSQKGKELVVRMFNFSPMSDAFFTVPCLSKNCIEGGFEMTEVVSTMVRNHKAKVNGLISCQGTNSANDCSDIQYEVVVRYLSSK